MTKNAAERGVALDRKSWLFEGSERGGDRAAFMYTVIVTAKLNDIDPKAWLADVLKRLPDIPINQLMTSPQKAALRGADFAVMVLEFGRQPANYLGRERYEGPKLPPFASLKI